MEFRIKYKICLLAFNSLHGYGPECIYEMLIPRIINYRLRSQDDLTLVAPRTKRKTLGGRAYGMTAPTVWNSLPKDVRSCNDVTVFKSKLKTNNFGVGYN